MNVANKSHFFQLIQSKRFQLVGYDHRSGSGGVIIPLQQSNQCNLRN